MSECQICKKDLSAFFMNNRPVCFHCDVLLFDIEIECEPEVEMKKDTLPIGKRASNEITKFN